MISFKTSYDSALSNSPAVTLRPDIHAPAVPARSHAKEHWRERDQVIEIMAIYKFVKAAGLIAIDAGIIKMLNPATSERVQSWILALGDGAVHPTIHRWLTTAAHLSPTRMRAIGVVALLYAILFMIEGIGLWHQSKWAEWLTIIATSTFIPLEVYELSHRPTIPLAAALIVNLVVVAYLIFRLRHPEERVRLV
jgi:uncharacterized membrane protein (DUF2068 family)